MFACSLASVKALFSQGTRLHRICRNSLRINVIRIQRNYCEAFP